MGSHVNARSLPVAKLGTQLGLDLLWEVLLTAWHTQVDVELVVLLLACDAKTLLLVPLASQLVARRTRSLFRETLLLCLLSLLPDLEVSSVLDQVEGGVVLSRAWFL